MIRKQNIYTQTIGEGDEEETRMITEELPIDALFAPTYLGHALIGIQTPQGIMEQPIRFRINDAADIKDAFAKFVDARAAEAPIEAKKIVDMMKEQFEEERGKIVIPGP